MKFLLLSAVLFLTACTSVPPVQEKAITVDQLIALKGKKLLITKRKPQDFMKATPKLLDGTIGGPIAGPLMTISEGNKFIRENNIIDPAFDINKKLAIALQENYGIINSNNSIEISSNKIEEIINKSPSSSLILDFQTTYWGIVHSDEKCFFCSKDYVVTLNNAGYSSKVVLIDVESKAIIAESGCDIPITKDTDEKIPFEKYTANNAELIKVIFSKASDECMNKAKTGFGIR